MLSRVLSFRRLKTCYAILGTLGVFLFVVLAALWPPRSPFDAPPRVWLGLAAAAGIGLALRGARRRLFFGPGVSFHQSFAFEVVTQCARLLSPLLPHRDLERAFMEKETRLGQAALIAWAKVRLRTMALMAAAALTLFLGGGGWGATAIAVTVGATIAAAWGRTLKGFEGRAVGALLFGASVWVVEGALFVLALAPFIPIERAIGIYLIFTALMDAACAPFAVGFAELAVLAAPSGAALTAVLFFHAARLLAVFSFGAVYLYRYKFSPKDFFNVDILKAIQRTRRPDGGWPFSGGNVPADAAPFLSVVIPAYNEAKRLPEYLESVVRYMEAVGPETPMEAMVVDDGSSDETVAKVSEFCRRDPRLRLIVSPVNRGKGAAVRLGISRCRGHYVLFADADGATPIAELGKFLPLARNGAEIVIGSRRGDDNADTVRDRNAARALMGQVFYSLVNYLAVPGVRDTQCGFKMFRQDIADRLFGKMLEERWAFDVELLYLAQLYGYDIREIAVNWREIAGSKLRPVRDALKMLVAVFRIRQAHGGFLKNG